MKIVVVDDVRSLRDLLRIVIVEKWGYDVVGEAEDVNQAVETIVLNKPELVILDLFLSDANGLEIVDVLKTIKLSPRILVFSGHCDEYTVFAVNRAQVHGFIDKTSCGTPVLLEAIRTVSEGRTYFSESFRALSDTMRRNGCSFDKIFTDRERTILLMLGDLRTDTEIARLLSLSVLTVEKHRLNIGRKLGLYTRTEVELWARRHGFITSACTL